jgi:FlaA1/EpsC-like NDP-sugar epimerase
LLFRCPHLVGGSRHEHPGDLLHDRGSQELRHQARGPNRVLAGEHPPGLRREGGPVPEVWKQGAEQVVRRISQEAGPEQAFVSVRFGNVLGSRGSVVPVFQEQVRVGGPITITDPEMKRYFMTIPEASQLVIQAGSLGENGAVYVLDMGTQVRIVDLARDLIRLSGSEEDDIDFVFTGLRPGEKLEEELFTAEEQVVATRYDEIMVARTEPPIATDFWGNIDELLACAQQREWAGMDRLLGSLLPDLGDRTALSSQTRRVLAS